MSYMYELSDNEKKWAKEQLREFFYRKFIESRYSNWWTCDAADRNILVARFFREKFVGDIFEILYKCKMSDERAFSFYTYFRDELIPKERSKI